MKCILTDPSFRWNDNWILIMKKIIEQILATLAKQILYKYKPKIVGITGSIGKTSAKEAVFAVLNYKFKTRTNIKNYNNELGVPLTIINSEAKGKSVFGWLYVFLKAIKMILIKDKDYPEYLVLEMGADKPGDIEYLVNIAKPHIGVVTKVSPTHIEFFKSLDGIAKEKRKIVTCLNEFDYAILNFDDERVLKMQEKTRGQIITFGHKEGADVRAVEFANVGEAGLVDGIKFKVQHQGSTVPVILPHVVGAHQMNAALIASAVGIAVGMNLVDISEGLKKYRSPKGRMNVIAGINNSLLIDDTYNSSPEAAVKAVEAVAKLNMANYTYRIAILGDMLELGDISNKEHYELGKQVAENGFNLLISVGNFSNEIARGAKDHGLTAVINFENSVLASEKISDLVRDSSLILIKGSQGSRMERVVESLMAEPDQAKDLLVRQTDDWLKK